jgi:hypothetical protein
MRFDSPHEDNSGLKSLVNKSAGAVGKVVTKGTGAVGKAVTKGATQIGKTLNAIADSPDKQVIEDPENYAAQLEPRHAQRSMGGGPMGFDDNGTWASLACCHYVWCFFTLFNFYRRAWYRYPGG